MSRAAQPDRTSPHASAVDAETAIPAAAPAAALPPTSDGVRFAVVYLFVILGPPLGALALAPVALWALFGDGAAPLPFRIDLSTTTVLLGLFGVYLTGGLPALLTGIVVARYWSHLRAWRGWRGWRGPVAIGLVGFAVAAVLAVLAALLRGSADPVEMLESMLMLGLPGFAGAALLSGALRWIARLRSSQQGSAAR